MMTCAHCNGAVASPFYGADGITAFCGNSCRTDAQVEAAALALHLRTQQQDK